MAQEVLREFLVKLGFVSDEPGLRKFTDGIGRATKSVVLLSTAVGAVATAAAYGIQRLAAGMESLYFSAQRTGSTTAELKSLQVAAENFGASADEVQASVEGMASTIRKNSAMKGILGGYLAQVGETVSDDMAKNLENLGKYFIMLKERFGAQGVTRAEQISGQFGIDEHSMLAIMHPELIAQQQQQLKNLGGVGGWYDKATKDAHRFEGEVRTLGTVLEGFGAQVFDALETKLNTSLPKITEWLQLNGPRIAKNLAQAVRELMDWIDSMIPKVKEWASKFMDWDRATGGWLVRIAALTAALSALGGGGILGGVASLAGGIIAAFGPVGIALAAVAAAIVTVKDGFEWINKTYPSNILNRMLGNTPQQQSDAAMQRLENETGGPPPGTGGFSGWLLRLTKNGISPDVFAGQEAAGGYIDPGSSASALRDLVLGTGQFNPALAARQSVPSTPLAGLGGTQQQITQQITFNISGAGDPGKTAKAVTSAMQNIARNAANGGMN